LTPNPASKECVRVLLVDDSARDAKAVRAFLHEETGAAEVLHVRTLHGAIESLGRRQTDVVIASPRLPDAKGASVVEELVRAAAGVPVFVLTSPLEPVSQDATRLGAHDVLVKGSFDSAILWRSIRAARETHRAGVEVSAAMAARDSVRDALRQALETDDTGVVVVGEDGRVRFANSVAAGFYGVPPAQIVGTLFPHVLVPGSLFSFDLARSEGDVVGLRVTCADLRWDGAPAYLVRMREAGAKDEPHRPSRPERARLEAVGRLASGIAHDVNNLVTALHVATNLAAERLAGEAAGREEAVARRLASIDACAHRAAVLVRQLLAVSRRRHASPSSVDVHAILDEMRPILRSALGETVRVTVVPKARAPWAFADPGSLEDAMLNLALHASDAMRGSGGAWLVETEDVEVNDQDSQELGVVSGAYLRISFSDTGPGIDVDRLPRLFDPHTAAFGPTLGLAEAGAIVRSASGSLEVESSPGSGTTFRVLLPRSSRPVPDEAPAEDVPEAPAPAEGAAVLLVEDMGELREIARDSLTAAGYRVFDACSGDEGLRAFAEAPVSIDLVVTDVVMPGSSGPDMVRKLREEHPALRALFMSSRSPDDLAHLWQVSPDDLCLEKPFRKSEFLAKVAEALVRGQAATASEALATATRDPR
jgi:signal transduction histidine kinase/DNA-binding response OmpR family regulator